ncbi:hypothetical protein OROMI_016073 [Orobanche minor]
MAGDILCLQVRYCRRWQVPAHGNFSESLELLLVDKFVRYPYSGFREGSYY